MGQLCQKIMKTEETNDRAESGHSGTQENLEN
jgi:hypothetical protein